MNFLKSLSEMGNVGMVYPIDYVRPTFSTEENVLESLSTAIKENRRLLVYGDYDMDGVSCVEIFKETFNYVGYSNYEVYRYSSRTHEIDFGVVNKAITENFEYLIISDSGSQEPEIINRLNYMGIKVILLDHHQSAYDYSDFHCSMINTTFENRFSKEEYTLSAGALVYIVCDKLIQRLGFPELESISALALASLYADSIDMSADLNRGIYFKAVSLKQTELPRFIQHFMTQGNKLNRNYIDYQFSPKINSLFRSESFDLLNKYLFLKPGHTSIADLVKAISESRLKYRSDILLASDIITHEVLDNFVIGNLSSVAGFIDIPEDKIHNYTGLVATQLCNKYKKTAVVYADAGTRLKGSLRDLHGRNYLELFKQFCKANGHNSAFGINIDYLDFSHFISYIKIIDKQYFIRNVGNEPVVIMHNTAEPDMDMITDMAMYNEFSGNNAPIALISKIWSKQGPPIQGQYSLQYKWGESYIKTDNKVPFGSTLLIKPYRGYSTAMTIVDVK
jgi:single-stranded-DNA-specific exonuclease